MKYYAVAGISIGWPSKDAAEGFYNSDEYKPHLVSRRNGSRGSSLWWPVRTSLASLRSSRSRGGSD